MRHVLLHKPAGLLQVDIEGHRFGIADVLVIVGQVEIPGCLSFLVPNAPRGFADGCSVLARGIFSLGAPGVLHDPGAIALRLMTLVKVVL